MTAQTSFKSANQLLREGKLDAAVAAYREAIAVNPGFSHAHHNLGEALVKAGRVDEAVAAFRRAVELNPQAVWSLFKLGELLRGRERFEEAVGFLRRAVELKSDVAEFNLGLGAALVRLGSALEEAEACLRRAVELNPFLAEAFYFLGVAASRRGQWSEAVEFYGRGLDVNPSGVECGLGLGEALGKLGRWSEAVERYGQMVLASGPSGEVCFGLGQALGQLGRWEEAVVEYRRAVALGFAGAEVRHHLGYALGQLGRWEEGVVEYRLVVEVNPKSAPVRHQLGYALMRLGRWGEAAVELRRSVELYPGSAVVWQQLGDVLRELGEDEEAVGVYRRALELQPGLAGVEERLAELLSVVGSFSVKTVGSSMKTELQQVTSSAILQRSQEKIRQFHNKHLGQRCVIIGNGPSLNEMDLSFLKHEVCFGTNKIYLGFERWEFLPTYYVAVNPLVIEQSVNEIREMSCPKFIGNRGISYFDAADDIIFLKTFPPPGEAFSKRADVGLNEGSTVTYVAMQLAYYMGFSEVILIGLDHHFVAQGTPHEAVVSDGDDPNHFDPRYFGKGLKWQLPDLAGSEKSYRIAKQVFEESGGEIIDATVNGCCQVFPKPDYQTLFKKNLQDISGSFLVQKSINTKQHYPDRKRDTIRVYVNLSAINFKTNLGVWSFGKKLLDRLFNLPNIKIIGIYTKSQPLIKEESNKFHEILEIGSCVLNNDGVEVMLHHFQPPLTTFRKILIFHDLHLWDVRWKYPKAEVILANIESLLSNVNAVVTEFPRTYYDLPRVLEKVPNSLFLLTSPTLKEYHNPDAAKTQSICQKFLIQPNTEVVLYPAQYQPHKNHVNLFKSIKMINRSNLKLICPGSEFKQSHTTLLLDAIDELQLNEQVVLAGHLNDEEFYSLLHRSNLVISASLAEGGAYTAQEGILYHKKIAFSNIRPAIMHLKFMKAKVPTFDPLNLSDMARTIEWVLNNQQDNSVAYQQISQWTWEELAKRFFEILLWVYGGCTPGKMPLIGTDNLGTVWYDN